MTTSAPTRVLQPLAPGPQFAACAQRPSTLSATFPEVRGIANLQASGTERDPTADPFAKRKGLPPMKPDESGTCEAKRAKLEPGVLDRRAQPAAPPSSDQDAACRPSGGRPPVAPAPSDFEGFHAQIRQSRMASTSAQPQLQTFLDISANKGPAVPASDGMQRHSYHAMLRSLGDAKALSRAPSLALGDALAASGQQQQQQQQQGAAGQELQVPHMPYDWALKRSVRFSSTQPLLVCERALRLDPHQVGQAQDAFMSCRPLARSADPDLTPEAQLHAALQSWRFPDQCWDSATVQALLATPAPVGTGVSSGGAAAGASGAAAAPMCLPLSQRLSAWRGALRSAYLQMRSGHCPAFYLLTQGPRPLTLLFCGAGVQGCAAGPHALVAQSTKLLRSRLTAAGIAFVLPLAPVEQDERMVQQAAMLRKVDADGDLDSVLEEPAVGAGPSAGPSGRVQWTSVRDHSPESLLLLAGPHAVHGLFDLLLNDVRFLEQQQLWGGAREAADVPAIIAPVAFEGAALHRPPLKLRAELPLQPGNARAPLSRQASGLNLVSSGGGSAAADDGDKTMMSSWAAGGPAGPAAGCGGGMGGSLELAGPVPPWVVHRVWHVLQEAQQGSLQATLESDPACLSVNMDCSQLGAAGAASRQRRAGGDGDGSASGSEPQDGCAARAVRGTCSDAEASAVRSGNAPLQKRVIKAVVCQPGGCLLVKLS